MDALDSLFGAIYAGDTAAVSAAVSRDPALARARNAETLSALQFARFMGRPDVFDALIAAGPALDFFEAASLDLVSRASECVEADATLIAAYSADGFTALHLAAYYGAPGAVRLLLDRGADPNAVTHNFLANMPIHAAAAGRHIDNCVLLLERGADVNAKQHGGFTPLHTPAQHGDRAMVELFLAHGADPGISNDEGKTPADLAAAQGNAAIAAMLRCAM